MGKQQQRTRKDRAAGRHNPVRVPDQHLAQGANAAKGSAHRAKEDAILPIVAKLAAPDAEDRVWACAAVTNLIQNDPATRRLLQGKNIVGALIERLSDSVEDVVVESSGALRNLCIDGGYDLCAELYNKGVLSPLSALIPQITNTLNGIFTSAPLDAKKDLAEVRKRKLVYDLAENVLTILWCLSETSDKALKAINHLSLPPFLISFLASRQSLPLRLVTAAAQCLYVLTEDNYPAAKAVKSEGGWVATVVEVAREGWGGAVADGKGKGKAAMDGVQGASEADEKDLLLKLLAAGTLRHLGPLPPPMPLAAEDLDTTLVVPLLDRALRSVDVGAVVSDVERLAVELPDAATIAAQLKSPKTDHKTDAERALEAIEGRLTALVVGLEVLMGVCSKVPEGGRGEDGEEDEEETDEPVDEDDMMEDVPEAGDDDDADVTEALIAAGRENGDLSAVLSTPLPPVLEAFLTTLALPSRLLALAAPNALSFLPLSEDGKTSLPSVHPPTTALVSTIHLRALETLNNLLVSTTFFLPAPGSPALGTPEWQAFFVAVRGLLQPVWERTFALLGELAPSTEVLDVKGQEVRQELLDNAVSCLRGVAALTRGAVQLANGQVDALIGACEKSERDGFRTRVLGTLGALAMKDVDVDQQTIENNKKVGTYLLKLLATPTPQISPEALVVVLNALFDMYADENSPWDRPVFRAGGFLGQMKGCVTRVRGITRAIDKRKTPELRARADEAYDNLIAFCKYRQSVA